MLLEFTYQNWRGDVHTYVIEPESISFGNPDPHWYLNGMLVTRSGDPRPELADRRRSFILAKMIRIAEVPRSV